jgi:O-acetyl-ADP-ribose deacetylase (regulator of RNase III)
MKIIYRQGNLLQAPETHICHGCNAQGVMGSGVARAIRDAYPKAYEDYRDEYERHGLGLGATIWVEVPCPVVGTRTIINAITQQTFGSTGVHVDYDAVRAVMAEINARIAAPFFAMPKIGAGLGGGDWDVIESIIEEETTRVQPVVYVFDNIVNRE